MQIFIFEDEIHGYRKGILDALHGHDLTVTTTYDEALAGLSAPDHPVFDWWLLDHDMHGYYEPPDKEGTGSALCNLLVTLNLVPTGQKVILHSQNGPGRRRMREHLEKAGAIVDEFSFAEAYLTFLRKTIRGTPSCAD